MGDIFFCGDPHGEFGHILEVVDLCRPAAIVLLGDMQAQHPLEEELWPILELTDVWWIPGNHDTDSDSFYDHLFGSKLKQRNLHGRVVEIAGKRVAGLGGIFRSHIWLPEKKGQPAEERFQTPKKLLQSTPKNERWRDGIPRKHRSSIFPSEYSTLAKQRADILVSHEAPSCHPYGFEAIDRLATSLGVNKSFHGHHHDSLDYSGFAQSMGFRAFGVGHCGVCDQDGRAILNGLKGLKTRYETR